MHLLLDTHAFLWYVWGDPQLSFTARDLIDDTANSKYISVASIWEMAIKISIGKLTLAKPLDTFLIDHLDGNGFIILPIDRAHAEQVVTLPFHHRDPFDRMLVAQCQVERLPLISADTVFHKYSIQIHW